MNGFLRRPFDPDRHRLTPPEVFFERSRHRREFLQWMGRAAGIATTAGLLLPAGCAPSEQEVSEAGRAAPVVQAYAAKFPAPPNPEFQYGRNETESFAAARFTNFYEFGTSKMTYRYVGSFEPSPWTVVVDGLCAKPREFALDDLYRLAAMEERAYRHRCVETWAMCVPWSGFELRHLLAAVEPLPAAKFVRFETFLKPEVAENQQEASYPWPYAEAVRLDEARNELAFLALGIYGEPLPKQHGAPVRLVLPWKYGFKSIKSIVRISLTDVQPATFWNEVAPREYGFEANVDPGVPHPRWSQRTEYMLGSRERFETVRYNGYGDWVAALYPA